MHLHLPLALLVAILGGRSALGNFALTSYYEQDGCYGQPLYITSSASTTCQVGSNDCRVRDALALKSNYSALDNTCLAAAVDLTGRVSDYVTIARMNGAQCAGEPSSLVAIVADALCHTNPSTPAGDPYRFVSANCNGRSPLYQTCRDSRCEDCQTATFKLGCNDNSVMVACVRASPKQAGNPSKFDDQDSSALPLLSLTTALLGLAPLLLLVAL